MSLLEREWPLGMSTYSRITKLYFHVNRQLALSVPRLSELSIIRNVAPIFRATLENKKTRALVVATGARMHITAQNANFLLRLYTIIS